VLPHPPTLPAPNAPQPVTSAEVRLARDRIRDHVRRTPVLTIERRHLGLAPGAAVAAKLDLLQPTGSFKVRGAVSLVASVVADGGPPRHVVAASGGNFGLAIAWAAARFGQHATIVVPATSPREKIDPLRALGAEARIVDGYYADALAEAHRIVAETDALSAHAYDQREVVAGQGTAVAELLEDVDVDTVIVACGGGGLLAGSIASAGPDVRIVAVETPGTPALHAALAAGAPVDVEVSGVAASSLGARRLGGLAWAARDGVHAALLVSDADVRQAQRMLWSTARLVAEPGGATALAALTSGAYAPEPGERVAVLVCGANTDPASVVTPSASSTTPPAPSG
jgi:threonine dehydratase